MTENAVVRARVNEKVKKRAAKKLAAMGLTVSDAMRITLTRIAKEDTLECLYGSHEPNEETAEVLRKSMRGEDVIEAKDINDLFAKLGI
jgi:DNA-damage-inducible protein J